MQEMSRETIDNMKLHIAKIEDDFNMEELKQLSKDCFNSNNKYFHIIGECIDAKLTKNKEKCQLWAYKLANSNIKPDHFIHTYNRKFKYTPTTEDINLANRIIKCPTFDDFSFVMAHTHYDECDNGYYFRRS